MKYSVYNYSKRAYDYFEGPGQVPASGWMRRASAGPAIPECIAAQLPASAQQVGSGQTPLGLIAVRQGGGLAGLGTSISEMVDVPPLLPLLAGALVAFAVYKFAPVSKAAKK